MNKQEYLEALNQALSGIPESEKQKTLDYYTEIIDDAMEEGEEEASIIARLDSPSDIGRRLIDETPLRKFVTEDVKKHKIDTLTAILLAISSPLWVSLLLAAIVVIFALYIAVWSLVISLFAVFAALVCSAIAFLLATPFVFAEAALKAMLFFGFALISIGLSVFLFFFSVWCSKQVIRFTLFLFRKVKESFVKKGSAAV